MNFKNLRDKEPKRNTDEHNLEYNYNVNQQHKIAFGFYKIAFGFYAHNSSCITCKQRLLRISSGTEAKSALSNSLQVSLATKIGHISWMQKNV